MQFEVQGYIYCKYQAQLWVVIFSHDGFVRVKIRWRNRPEVSTCHRCLCNQRNKHILHPWDNKRSSHFSLPSSVMVDDFLKRETLEGILHYSKVAQLSWQKRDQKKKKKNWISCMYSQTLEIHPGMLVFASCITRLPRSKFVSQRHIIRSSAKGDELQTLANKLFCQR